MDKTYENGLAHGRQWAKRYKDFGFATLADFVSAHEKRMSDDHRACSRRYALATDQFQNGVMAGIQQEENN